MFNWLHVNPFIGDCLPRYDGSDYNGSFVPVFYGKVQKADGKEIVVKGHAAFGQEGPVYHCRLAKELKVKATDDTDEKKPNKSIQVRDIKEGDEVKVKAFYRNERVVGYWTKAAVTARDAFLARQSKPKDANTARPDEGIDDLVQVNLEAVMPRYCDDLSKVTLYTSLEGKNKERLLAKGLPEADIKNPPKGAGWLIELRGYTYHKASSQFLLDTLVAKLNAYRAPEQELWLTEIARVDPKKIPSSEDPIDGRVSHALLYDYAPVKNPKPGEFELLTNSVVKDVVGGAGRSWDPLVGGGGVGSFGGVGGGKNLGGGGRGPVMGPSGNQSSGMTGPVPPPGGRDQASMGPGFMRGQGGSGRSGSSGPIAPPGMPGFPGSPGSNPPAGKETTPTPSGPHKRTEFVVIFIWREPTPSDKLLGPETAAPSSSGSSGKGPVFGPGMGGPGSGVGPGGPAGQPGGNKPPAGGSGNTAGNQSL